MNEERWHNFAKEKPSADMEGRNFIVSNGHYEKIATWCGYWENEPFMGDRLCDEVVRWKFYFTPGSTRNSKSIYQSVTHTTRRYSMIRYSHGTGKQTLRYLVLIQR